ncbi:MAG: hypothetical protein COB02_15105 [Candidatus Cloacimonadota bacterium]|nr:MAG: hypothetical protein COB02_15105 [Candidatus Cloacimonadota bacterium]
MQSYINEKFKILIVDDNPSIHEDFRKILSPKNHLQNSFDALSKQLFDDELPRLYKNPEIQLDFAFQGEEAIKLVETAYQQNQPYLLIFMDIRMPPGIDGIETIKKIWDFHPDQEVIICTAFTDYSWTAIQKKLSIKNSYLVLKKPFDAIEVKQLTVCLIAKTRVTLQSKAALNELKLEKEKVEIAYQKLMTESQRHQFIEQQVVQAQKMDIVATVANGLTQDFNDILNSITKSIQSIQLNTKNNLILQDTSNIKNATNRAQSLINQLSSISKNQKIILNKIDINKNILRVIKICEDFALQNIKVKLLNQDAKFVLADSIQIEQVLLNIALNAKDSMPNGGTLSFDINTVQPSNDFLLKYPNCNGNQFQKIIIRDTGEGIPQKLLTKVFDPFFTTKIQDKKSGLGLSMAFQIIQQHHGFIEVFSEQNLGTMFCIYLPIAQNLNTEKETVFKEPLENKGTILIVDDEEVLRIITKGILKSYGYKTILAENGLEGVEKFQKYKNDISLVLLDLVMPKMSGNECYQKIMELGCEVPVLLCSGYKKNEELHKLLLNNNCFFIQKPYTLHQLIQSIDRTSFTIKQTKEEVLAPKILLADDEIALNMAISKHLSLLGYRVDSVSSGTEAWDLYQKSNNDPYDLVIIDLLIPNMGGMQLSENIRTISQEVPILLISIKINKTTLKQAMKYHINDFLDKPISLSKIQETVAKLLNVKK